MHQCRSQGVGWGTHMTVQHPCAFTEVAPGREAHAGVHAAEAQGREGSPLQAKRSRAPGVLAGGAVGFGCLALVMLHRSFVRVSVCM